MSLSSESLSLEIPADSFSFGIKFSKFFQSSIDVKGSTPLETNVSHRFFLGGSILENQYSWTHLSQNMGACQWYLLSPPPQHKHRATCERKLSPTLANLLTSPTYLCPGGTILLSQASLSPRYERSLPQKTNTSLFPYHISQPESSAGPQFSWSWHQVSFHKKTRAHLVKTCYIQAWDQNLSTAGKENLCIQLAWRLEQSKHSSKGHTAHTGVTSRSARPWAPRDLFFIRPLFSGAGDTTSFSNT